jgi:hypothetical protein
VSKAKKALTPEPFVPPGMTFPEVQGAFKREGYGDAAPKTESDQFVHECLEWLAKWFEQNPEPAGVDPFMFVFEPNRRTQDVFFGAQYIPSFCKTFELGIGGRIYASTSNLRHVYGIATSAATCPELLAYLNHVGMSSLTAVAVSAEKKLALVHSSGDIDDAYSVPFERLSAKDFDFTQLDEYLGEFYEAHLSTHDGLCDIWAKPTKRKLKQYAERQIQKTLQAFFQYRVLSKSAKVDREIQTHAGREDLRIIRAKPDRTLEGALMELKVLRPTLTEEKNLEWAKDGVDQAARYAKAEDMTAHRYVCCYDGRKVDAPMPAAVAYAREKLVTWRRYFMQTPQCSRAVSGFDS